MKSMPYRFEKPVYGTIANEKYQCTIEWRNGEFFVDEPEASGGKDAGPDPYTLLLSSLAACTLITLRMYIDRKKWIIPQVGVNVNMCKEVVSEKATTIIDRHIIFPEGVPADQKARLLDVAERCPISRLLEGETKVINQ